MNNTHYLDWDGLVKYNQEIKKKLQQSVLEIKNLIPTKVVDLSDSSNYITTDTFNEYIKNITWNELS